MIAKLPCAVNIFTLSGVDSVVLVYKHCNRKKLICEMNSLHQLTGTRLIFLYIVVSFAYIIWGIYGSLLPPFFPDEAKSKRASISQSGFVFGVFSLAGFISSPFFGKYGGRVSPRFLYIYRVHLQ